MSQSSKIAVIIPSRGLIFSQTADEMLQNVEGLDYDVFFAHQRPIPDCFEEPLLEALNGSYTHFWFIEDDMILPKTTLRTLLELDVPVAACDYPVAKSGQGAVFKNAEGKVIFTGTGCLLVKRAVFDQLEAPYFRTDIRWNAVNYGSFIRMTANEITNPDLEGYGLHDTNFGMKLWKAGIPISVTKTLGQRKLIALGQAGSNDGAHKVERWEKVKPDFLLKKFQKMPPQPLGRLIPVNTVDGEMMVHPDKARKLIKAGTATKVPKQSVVIDWNGLDL